MLLITSCLLKIKRYCQRRLAKKERQATISLLWTNNRQPCGALRVEMLTTINGICKAATGLCRTSSRSATYICQVLIDGCLKLAFKPFSPFNALSLFLLFFVASMGSAHNIGSVIIKTTFQSSFTPTFQSSELAPDPSGPAVFFIQLEGTRKFAALPVCYPCSGRE